MLDCMHACMHACSSMNDEWCCNRPFLCLLRMRDRKRPTDRPSDRRTNMNSYRYARPHLKRRDIAEVWAVNEVRVIEKAIQRLTRQTRCLYCLTEMTTITMTTTTKAKTDFDNDRGVKLWLWWKPTPSRRHADSTPTPRRRRRHVDATPRFHRFGFFIKYLPFLLPHLFGIFSMVR